MLVLLMAPIGGNKAAGGGGVRTWLQLDWRGESQILEAGKHEVMRRTGLSGLDLRILDPLLSYPSTLLGRDRAVVVHLDHIKAIIMVRQVLVLNYKDPNVAPFLDELRNRIVHHRRAVDSLGEQSLRREIDSSGDHGPKLLPFEFVVLEACLDAACNCLDKQATTLEEEAYPALDHVTSKVCTLNLERVHKIKSRLAELTRRVQQVRDELERVLNNDDYVAKMYLTNKDAPRRYRTGNSSLSSIHNGVVQRVLNERVSGEIFAEKRKEISSSSNVVDDELQQQQQLSIRAASSLSRGSYDSPASTKRIPKSNKHLDVKELELILESYFVQIDASLNGLSTLREYVDDTEDYINIYMDDKRNTMMQVDILFLTASTLLMAFATVTGIFSMNIRDFSLFQRQNPPNFWFSVICSACMACCIIFFLIGVLIYKYMGLL